MKKTRKTFKLWYIIPNLSALLVAVLLIWLLAPSEFYTKAILIVIISLLVLASGIKIVTNQRIKIIREQLHQIIHSLEEFDFSEPQKIRFEESPFPIFNELNEYLSQLINRIRTDFQANKQFTENASHELQTPLAIIKGHVELLVQSSKIGEKEIESLTVVLQNTNRLSKLNRALILLSKIEQQRFADFEKVDFILITDETLKKFNDLIQIRGLEIRKDYQNGFEIEMNDILAEILITNLLQNAIRHNIGDGFIEIKISGDSFSISNPGKKLEAKPEDFFKRFKRESDVEESLGLGLSIVKKICEQSGLVVSYHYDKELHTLLICKN